MEHLQANIRGVNRSVVAVGTTGDITHSVTESAGDPGIGNLPELLALLNGTLPELSLDPSTRAEVQAEIQTAQAQLASPRPKQVIIGESLRTIRAILEGVAGNAAHARLLEVIDRMIP